MFRLDRFVGTRRIAIPVALVALVALVVPTFLGAPGAGAAGPVRVKAPTGITGPAPAGEGVRGLLPYVPASHRYSCVAQDPAGSQVADQIRAEAASITAAAVCGPDGPAASVGYFEFGDVAAMNRAYSAIATTLGPSTNPDCEGDHGWSYGDDSHGGRLLCFVSTTGASSAIPPTAVVVWTADDRRTIGYASTPIGDDDAAALTDWWDESAGPTKRYDDTGLASPSNREDGAFTADLRRAIPTPTRAACAAGDRTSPDSIGPTFFNHRFFVEAVAVCTQPDPAVDVVYYARIADGAVEDFASQVYSLSDEQLSEDGKRCPTQSSYSIGRGKAKRRLGTYACYFLDNGDGTQRVVWRWTDTRQDVLGVAVNNVGDADALRSWWASSRSGPIQP